MKYYKIRITEWRDNAAAAAPHPELIAASTDHQAALNEWRTRLDADHQTNLPHLVHLDTSEARALRAANLSEIKNKIDALDAIMRREESVLMAKITAHPMVGTFGWQEIETDADGKLSCVRITNLDGAPYPASACYGYAVVSSLLDAKE